MSMASGLECLKLSTRLWAVEHTAEFWVLDTSLYTRLLLRSGSVKHNLYTLLLQPHSHNLESL
jgi:hypothetical protein